MKATINLPYVPIIFYCTVNGQSETTTFDWPFCPTVGQEIMFRGGDIVKVHRVIVQIASDGAPVAMVYAGDESEADEEGDDE